MSKTIRGEIWCCGKNYGHPFKAPLSKKISLGLHFHHKHGGKVRAAQRKKNRMMTSSNMVEELGKLLEEAGLKVTYTPAGLDKLRVCAKQNPLARGFLDGLLKGFNRQRDRIVQLEEQLKNAHLVLKGCTDELKAQNKAAEQSSRVLTELTTWTTDVLKPGGGPEGDYWHSYRLAARDVLRMMAKVHS